MNKTEGNGDKRRRRQKGATVFISPCPTPSFSYVHVVSTDEATAYRRLEKIQCVRLNSTILCQKSVFSSKTYRDGV